MFDDEFEWDDAKAAQNLAKHSLSFEDARVFADPDAIESDDLRFSYGKDRYKIIGMANGRLIFVAFTLRDERVRIISARGANPIEHRTYHEEKAKGGR